MDWEVLKNIATLVGAALALYVYYQNSRLRRAEWLASLYEKFFERSDLKTVREILDCTPGQSAAIDQLAAEEPAEFTDYLNFFEFVAVLRKTRQLKRR
jgi:Mlc titration factor MtfA (ptsG expression regulator)